MGNLAEVIHNENEKKDTSGLSTEKALKLLEKFGPNILRSHHKKSPILIFFRQFKDMMVIILLISTALSGFLGEFVEATAIIIVVIINSILGFIQEFRTEKTMEMLKNMAAPVALVLRDGVLVKLEAAKLVPGDVIFLEAGDRVPADARLIEAKNFQVDEALITGESLPVIKQVNGKIEEFIRMGTIIVTGRGKAIVTKTGMHTAMGQIADMLHEVEEEQTPLAKRLEGLGRFIAIGCLLICATVSLIGILRGEPLLDMLLEGISLAVAAVPEGLPAIVTISLAMGVQRMLKRNALVRKLPSVETLGCAGVICTDKTGTLTQNKMSVEKCFVDLKFTKTFHSYKILLQSMFLCNNSILQKGETVGEPTENALIQLAYDNGIEELISTKGFKRIEEIPFDSDRKMMTVICVDAGGNYWAISKGAPDIIIRKCIKLLLLGKEINLDEKTIKYLYDAIDNMAKEGLRVLGFSMKNLGKNNNCRHKIEEELIFIGLVGLIDPPREEVNNAILRCNSAGIKTVMITGDHLLTATAIAKKVGIICEESVGDNKALKSEAQVCSGEALDRMSDRLLEQNVMKISVFARVTPKHKLRIVKAYKKNNQVVAMTGDGVNDAPAIKEADIGVAMGKNGTEVTRESASMVLLDDNFATIVAAVEEGRVIYSNIRKFIRYMLSCNLGEVLTMFFIMVVGLPVPLLPIQILWVNLATDGLPAVALGLEPSDNDIMAMKPRKTDESVFAHGMLWFIFIRGTIIAASSIAAFCLLLNLSGSIEKARTAAFVTLCLTQLIHVFECKSETKNIFELNWLSNRWLIIAVIISLLMIIPVIYIPTLMYIFGTATLLLKDWLMIIGITLVGPVLTAFVNLRRR